MRAQDAPRCSGTGQPGFSSSEAALRRSRARWPCRRWHRSSSRLSSWRPIRTSSTARSSSPLMPAGYGRSRCGAWPRPPGRRCARASSRRSTTERHVVHTAEGRELPYDLLLLAPGRVPTVAVPGALCFRGPADAAGWSRCSRTRWRARCRGSSSRFQAAPAGRFRSTSSRCSSGPGSSTRARPT